MTKLVIATLLLFTSIIVNAQNKKDLPPAEQRAKMQTELMKDKLELNQEQTQKVLDINLKSALEMDQVFKLTDRVQKFKKFRSIQLKKDKDLKQVLSKNQFKAYKKFKSEMKKRIKKAQKNKK